MEISKAKAEQVLATLPIGYYTGRRVYTSIRDVSSSYYSLTEDCIVISFPQLQRGFDKIKQIKDVEGVVRNMIYHEVSHAILTSDKLFKCGGDKNVLNIFEDERIETVLRNYYHGVNFRKQLYDVIGVHKATKPIEAFFNAVRFNLAPKKYQNKINEIIKKYSNMNRSSAGGQWYDYVREVTELYNEIARDFESNSKDYQPSQEMEESSGLGGFKPGEADGEGNEVEVDVVGTDGKPEGEPSEGGEENRTVNPDTTMIGDIERNIMTTLRNIKNMFASGMDIKARLNGTYKKDLTDFQRTAELIINNFNKKNNSGSGLSSYTGVFNPRAVAREDYRWCERSTSVQGNNRFGSCHLNLFIDCSGSFSGSEEIVNAMLAALSAIERKNRNFSMDVVFCGEGTYTCQNVGERKITCRGGNNLPDNMKQTFLSLQKPNTCNYNIVLFDGDAFSDTWGCDDRCRRIFKTFDYKQTTLITDSDNLQYMKPEFTAAKVVVTDRYTEELISHIIHALMIAYG